MRSMYAGLGYASLDELHFSSLGRLDLTTILNNNRFQWPLVFIRRYSLFPHHQDMFRPRNNFPKDDMFPIQIQNAAQSLARKRTAIRSCSAHCSPYSISPLHCVPRMGYRRRSCPHVGFYLWILRVVDVPPVPCPAVISPPWTHNHGAKRWNRFLV